ncbi:hypothetical protein MCA0648 [Methylococcus capsulatus str. Bath]|uniref:Uncharacterized protein n=1 Tax=Methylococcus capsulatus (strain ATCC 33009 / NCIMB 11132 / Bath) TaxID=243233 RepID=Q60B36_METCA|nr:hypothetical protein MCA0648 [Methylococcus capsulatus str. Bath]
MMHLQAVDDSVHSKRTSPWLLVAETIDRPRARTAVPSPRCMTAPAALARPPIDGQASSSDCSTWTGFCSPAGVIGRRRGYSPSMRMGMMLAWGFIGIFAGSTLLAVSHTLLKVWPDTGPEPG